MVNVSLNRRLEICKKGFSPTRYRDRPYTINDFLAHHARLYPDDKRSLASRFIDIFLANDDAYWVDIFQKSFVSDSVIVVDRIVKYTSTYSDGDRLPPFNREWDEASKDLATHEKAYGSIKLDELEEQNF
jgi:hypothetical protein